ncbi:MULTISPECIES: amidohydrolase family protein [unclassified Novosphingobium]|uniref:amidohydrolase family protein n=1 Tax=unclassified Novosphingobium TaxID=2644732 RepID=UPI0025D7623F|nr:MULTISPECIES: amidohydrolase family protein [unclassified Novosphingobium]HQV04723.1 amidohydrolase family protein [Novosphingobium sp.]
MEVIDCHSHVASSRYIPDEFFDGWVDNILATSGSKDDRHGAALRQVFRKINEDPLCDEYVAQMDEAGIARAVLLIIDFKYVYGEPFDDMVEIYRRHREILERHPGRFICFAGVDPRRGRAGVELLELGIEQYGFSGLKLYPPCGFSPSDERLDPYYEVCAQYQLPVLSHIGPTTPSLSFNFARPEGIDEAARRFPQVKFVLGHAGSTHFRDAAVLAEYRPNVFLDMSGFQAAASRGRFDDLMRFHKENGILNKILFGTDWPIHRLLGAQKKWVDRFKQLCTDGILTQRELANIFGETFRSISPSSIGAA